MSVAVYHFQDNVGHLIALKVAEVVLRVCDLWYRVFHLNVEANMRGKIFEDLLVCSCASVNVHRRKLLVFPTAAALLQLLQYIHTPHTISTHTCTCTRVGNVFLSGGSSEHDPRRRPRHVSKSSSEL